MTGGPAKSLRAAACLLLLPAAALAGEAAAPKMNPQARLKVVKSTTLWKNAGKKLGARMARFSPDGSKLAWAVNGTDAGGGLFVADVATGKVLTPWPAPTGAWKAPAGGSVEFLDWGPKGDLAACVRTVKGDKVKRFIVLAPGAVYPSVPETDGAYRLAWSADGKTLAFSTKAGLFLHKLIFGDGGLAPPIGKSIKLVEVPEKQRPKKGPAFEDLLFYKNAVAARRVGTMRYTMVFPGEKTVDLGECRGLAPDPKRNRLYLVPWLAGPVKIPRGAGVAWIDPESKKPERKVIVPDRPATGGGKPYWLVDIWDWHYPTTLRVSKDGKTLTFAGVKAGVLSKNPWREFCIWRVAADGAKPPEAAAEAGVIFKRLDVGDSHCIGWRYALENACVFLDLAGGRAWRLPKGFYVQRANSDAVPGKLLVGGARGKDVVLFRLTPDD